MAALPAWGGDARTYLDVPRVTATEPAFFRARFLESTSQVVRIALFGDSQETAPSGAGMFYVAHLNARFAGILGAPTESVIYAMLDTVDPPHWLAATEGSAALRPTTIPADQTLPNFFPQSLVAGGGALPDWQRTLFLHDASRTVDPRLDGGAWFDQTGPFTAEVLALRRGNAPGLAWRNRPSDASFPDPGAAAVQSGVLSFGPKTPIDGYAWLSTPPLSLGGKRHLQLDLRGLSAKVGQDVVGVRLRSAGPQRGAVVQSIARGGLRLADFPAEYGGSGAMLRAVAPRVAVLHYGANDAFLGTTREEWRARLLAMIGWIRRETGDAQFPVIIASEVKLSGSPQANETIDWMPVVAHDLALADPRVLALNLRRVTEEEYGWGRWSMRHLYDGAHLMPYAQRLEAAAFVGELTQTLGIDDPGCEAPSWADCVRAWGSACMPGGCVPMIDVESGMSGGHWNGVGTTCDDADGDGVPDLCPPGGLGDINRDGFIDAADLAMILGNWGLSGGPADLDGNGVVGAGDLSILLSAWQR